MRAKTFNVSLPPELVELLDAQAKREFVSRNEYVKAAVVSRLKAEGALDPLLAKRTAEQYQRDKLKAFVSQFNFEELEDAD